MLSTLRPNFRMAASQAIRRLLPIAMRVPMHVVYMALTHQHISSHRATITWRVTGLCTTQQPMTQRTIILWSRVTRCGLSQSISPRCLARGELQTSHLVSTRRPGTMAGAITPTHSTTRGGAILTTRGTTGTGTSAITHTTGDMATRHTILDTIHTILDTIHTCTTLHVHHSLHTQDMVLRTSQEVTDIAT